MLKNIMLKAGFVLPGFMIFMVSPSYTTLARNLYETPLFAHRDSAGLATDSLAFGEIEDCPEIAEAAPSLPRIQLNAAASNYVKKFLVRNEEDLKMIEKRSAKYFRIIEPILERYGIPLELKYLAVVESQLKTSATSRVGAKGLWQLMPATARELGLKVNGKTDERTHAYKSTVAAAKYLRDLYRQFGDWLLVIAAYNSGPGYVYKAIKRTGSRNFWRLQASLPAETRSHVKRYIGTHCYFQEELSTTLLTKQEALAYEKELEAFTARFAMNEAAIAIQNPVAQENLTAPEK